MKDNPAGIRASAVAFARLIVSKESEDAELVVEIGELEVAIESVEGDFVSDAEATQPERILGFAVDQDVFGLYLPEGEAEPASAEVQQRAEALGIHPTLTLGTEPQVYVLVELWQPFGTTTNGWVTLYGPEGEAAPEQLVGIDPRRLDLLVFNRQE